MTLAGQTTLLSAASASTPVDHPCQHSEVDISLPDAVMETKRWRNRRGPEEDGGGKDVIPLLTLWPALISSLCQVTGSVELSWGRQTEGWRRQRQLHELGGAGARAVTHEGSRSFVIGSLGLMQTGARV